MLASYAQFQEFVLSRIIETCALRLMAVSLKVPRNGDRRLMQLQLLSYSFRCCIVTSDVQRS